MANTIHAFTCQARASSSTNSSSSKSSSNKTGSALGCSLKRLALDCPAIAKNRAEDFLLLFHAMPPPLPVLLLLLLLRKAELKAAHTDNNTQRNYNLTTQACNTSS